MENESNSLDTELSDTALPAKSAGQYADAINVISEIVDIAIDFIPYGSTAKKVAKYTPKVMKAAKVSASILDKHSDSVDAAIEKIRTNTPDAIKTAADIAKKGGNVLSDTVGKAFSTVSQPIKENIDASKNKKAQIEAHQKIIEHAAGSLTASQFLKNKSEHNLLTGNENSYLNNSGCYIFLTLKKTNSKNLANYQEVYVGSSLNMGSSIEDEIIGKGNPDVYADIKYKQNVYILFYPCEEADLERMKESLIVALDADESYNQDK